MSRRWRGLRQRRGVFLQVPPAQAAGPAPTWPPSLIASRRPRPGGVRRGRFLLVPRRVFVCPPRPLRRRPLVLPVPPARRGRFFALPAPAVVAAPQAWVPPILRASRPRVLLVRRGRSWPSPPPTAVPLAAWAPDPVGSRRSIGARGRRGSFLWVPPAQITAQPQAVVPRAITQSRRPRHSCPRRGRFYGPISTGLAPVAPNVPPQWMSRRRPTTFILRRGRFGAVPPAAAVPIIPAWVPGLTACRRARPTWTRRGRFLLMPSPAAQAPPRLIVPARARLLRSRRARFWSVPMEGAPPPEMTRGQMGHRPRTGSDVSGRAGTSNDMDHRPRGGTTMGG